MDGAAAATGDRGAADGPFAGNSSGPPAVETGVGLSCCQDCGEAFTEESACSEHRRRHPRGNRVFLDDPLDGLPATEKGGVKTSFCATCSLSFSEPSEFHSHMKDKHGRTSPEESSAQRNPASAKQQTFECPDCGKCYGVIGHFLNHQRSHRQASKSLFHDLEHLKKKSFRCESCGRSYSRASALDAHRRCHEEKLVKSRSRTSGDSFQAEEPAVEAKQSENHAAESPEKLYKCSCGKAFTALFRLKTHQRFSRNSQCSPEEIKEKPKKNCADFYCGECKKSFSGHIALFNHQRWHANHSDDSAKRFPCEECGKVFMTLTFYYRHQRTAHSDETPAKSFLHQVCQLQKKAFECQDCGLRFSRASALHAHQLHHTEVFRETEKLAQKDASLLPQRKHSEDPRKDTERSAEAVDARNLPPEAVVEGSAHVTEEDEDAESYEPGDFNVQVISASESEDEPDPDVNSDLELLCESDQDGKEDGESCFSAGGFVSKPEMDLKIIQIDFEPTDEHGTLLAAEAESKTAVDRFDCPECYRRFCSASSLRVHRMWHKKRQQTPGQSLGYDPANSARANDPGDPRPSRDAHRQPDRQESFSCEECGKCFSDFSSFVSHQSQHPKTKQFQCPDCSVSYTHASRLFNHMNNCTAQKKEYNPKKTLLGPKIYHCEQCGKGFWSLGAYSHHKQSPNQCAELRLRKGVVGSPHAGSSHTSLKVACPVCGQKFRHRGIMTLHMRKHENGNHKCELCNRTFRLFSSLLRHQVVHSDQLLPPPSKSFQHQVEQLKKNTYGCPDCGKLFSREKALQFHMKSHGYETGHSPSSPGSSVSLEGLQCASCLAHFNSKSSLKAHQKLCVKKEPVDGVDFKMENLENMPKDHADANSQDSDDKNSADPSDEKTSGCAAEAQIEGEPDPENPNANDLKYKCKRCDRGFSVIGALNLHKRIHARGRKKSGVKAKPPVSVALKHPKAEEPKKGFFHCSECGKRFTSSSAHSSHKKWHLERTESPEKEQLTDRPPLWDPRKPNSQRRSSPRPEVDASRDRPTFSCSRCNETFVENSLLAAHYETDHGETSEAARRRGDGSRRHSSDRDAELADAGLKRKTSASSVMKIKIHQCPLCPLSFTKARGLRAHKWQAHSQGASGENEVTLVAEKESKNLTGGVKPRDGASAVPNVIGAKRSDAAGGGQKKVKAGSPPPSAQAALLDHKVCKKMDWEPNQVIQTLEAEVSPPFSRLSELKAKFLYKCNKCGKAFQTEGHLGTHRAKAKSRPYCCALCCHGFWTENQLQQHLAWHDEVRCRLPNEVRFRLSAALSQKPFKPNASSDNRGNFSPSAASGRAAFNPEDSAQSSLKYRRCGKAFLSPAAFHNYDTQHRSDDFYRCSTCPRTFSEIQDLINHHQECFSDCRGRSAASAAAAAAATLLPGHPAGLTCSECGTTFCEETELHQHYNEHTRGLY